jgi:signal transduction histidine kinase
MSRPRWWVPAAVVVIGVAAAWLVAMVGGVPAHNTVRLLVDSMVGAGVAALVAAALLRALHRRRIAIQAAVAALAPILAVAIGVSWASSDMFLMQHDLRVLWVVLVAAGTVAVVAALLLGRRVADASRSMGDMARRLGDGVGEEPASAPGELGSLAAQLAATSARLADAQAEAAATEQSRRDLVAWVSHDLRTPLAGIRAMVEALEDGVVDDEATIARYYATMRHEVDRLAGLVDDLFELSRIHSGSLRLELEPVTLDELIDHALAGAAVTARAKQIELRNGTPEQVPVVELAAPEMVRVIRNLLDNAIRHTATGGTITVSTSLDRGGGAVRVAVRDGCGGIPEQDLPQVFDMGYQGDAARTPGDHRGGLGLAVARGLVEAHQGDIKVRNVGPGCEFTVLLPLRPARPAPIAPIAAPSPTHAT